jgi:hypothetical protein
VETRVKSLVIASPDDVKLGMGEHDESFPLTRIKYIPMTPLLTYDRLHTAQIAGKIEQMLKHTKAFRVHAVDEKIYEINEKQSARKIGSGTLHVVRHALVGMLRELSNVTMNKQHITRNSLTKFNPYMVFPKDEGPLQMDDRLDIPSLYLAQRLTLGGLPPSWYIAAEYPLGSGNETSA